MAEVVADVTRTPDAAMLPSPPLAGQRHSLFDDLQGLATGTLFVAIGVVLLRHAGVMTGGTAGIAILLNHATGWRFGTLLFLINLPFYALAWQRLGPRFTLKTFAAVALLSVLTEATPGWLALGHVAPVFAAVAGGLLADAGFIMLFRDKASLGGSNVLVPGKAGPCPSRWNPLSEEAGGAQHSSHVQAAVAAEVSAGGET